MRNLVLILILSLFFILPSNATECSKYLIECYSKDSEVPVKIVSKKEYVSEYNQKVGETQISAIAYGTGYMKKKKCRKKVITYICLLDVNCKPIWGYVIPR